MKISLRPVYEFFGGMTEFYAMVFTVVSIHMAYKNLLTPTFVAAIGAIQAIITANDIHNDLSNNNNTTVVVNNAAPPAAPPAV